MEVATVSGTIRYRAKQDEIAFTDTPDTTVGSLIGRFFPGEKICLTYEGHLLSPAYPLRLYNFKDGGTIVATSESDANELLPDVTGPVARRRRETDDCRRCGTVIVGPPAIPARLFNKKNVRIRTIQP
jgi:hypothetical protein